MWSQFSIQERKNLEELSRLGISRSTDLQTYYDLEYMAGNPKTRTAFRELNLMTQKSKLSESDFKHFSKMQMDMKKGGAASELDGIESKTSIVNNALRSAGVKFDGKGANSAQIERANRFRRQVDEAVVTQLQNTGKKKITNDEVRKITDDLMKEYVVGSSWFFFDETKRKFDMTPEDVIPKAKLKNYQDQLKKRGYEVNEKNIWRLYEADTGE